MRCNALVGATAAALELTYAALPLTDADFQSSIFPFTAFLDQETGSIARFADIISSTGNHPWRSFVGLTVTDTLDSGDVMPSVGTNGDPIIGIYGSVLDADDQTIVCTEYPEQVIRRRNNNLAIWTIPVYGFKMSGDGIVHTRPNGVAVQVCTFNWDSIAAIVAANGDLPLPDSLANAICYDMVGALVRDDEFVTQSAIYRKYADNAEMSIRQGLTSVSEQSIAGPTLINS